MLTICQVCYSLFNFGDYIYSVIIFVIHMTESQKLANMST